MNMATPTYEGFMQLSLPSYLPPLRLKPSSTSQDLVEDFRSELSGCFEDAVTALMIPSKQFDAVNLNKAVKVLPHD